MELRSFANLRFIFRAWYYFRLGYGTYLTFLLGYASTLVTVYYLAVRNAPLLLSLFPNFLPFAILATVVGAPLAVVIGWVHLKRSQLFSSELDISVEANPYQYKLPPGMAKEVHTPAAILQLRIMRGLAEAHGLLTDPVRAEFDELERKYLILLEGGYVGWNSRHPQS